MREVVGALLGVPAAIAIAGGLGLIIVSLWLRIRPRPGRPPLGWAHLALAVGMLGMGVSLLAIDIAIVGLS